MKRKLTVILGNQLFNLNFFEKIQKTVSFMAEDYGLCTFKNIISIR